MKLQYLIFQKIRQEEMYYGIGVCTTFYCLHLFLLFWFLLAHAYKHSLYNLGLVNICSVVFDWTASFYQLTLADSCCMWTCDIGGSVIDLIISVYRVVGKCTALVADRQIGKVSASVSTWTSKRGILWTDRCSAPMRRFPELQYFHNLIYCIWMHNDTHIISFD